MGKKIEYTNGELTIVWQPELCQHAGICVKMLPNVFTRINISCLLYTVESKVPSFPFWPFALSGTTDFHYSGLWGWFGSS